METEYRVNFHQAKFLTSASKLAQCPPDVGAEVAFAGRSNAGKSSALNALTLQKKLARISKTPGRTQLLNYFTMGNPKQRIVDLPGYGYAKVAKSTKSEWDKHLDEYLQDRVSLKGLILLMDIRHPLKEFDTEMLEWAMDSKLPCHILLTKSDKLKRGPAQSELFKVRNALQQHGDLISVQTFSSLKKTGLDDLGKKVSEWLALSEEPLNTSEPKNDEEQS